jgi:hypothetical protein
MNTLNFLLILILYANFLTLPAFRKVHEPMIGSGARSSEHESHIPADQALKAARSDAEQAYRDDLSGYRVCLSLEKDGWHVDYELKAPHSAGGGPHYIIDATTGKILAKRYEQ